MAATTTKTVASIASLPSREQFIADYLAKRAAGNTGAGKGFIATLKEKVENAAIDTVADSTRIAGRVSAAASAAGDGFHQAAAIEHARQAERMAMRLGL